MPDQTRGHGFGFRIFRGARTISGGHRLGHQARVCRGRLRVRDEIQDLQRVDHIDGKDGVGALALSAALETGHVDEHRLQIALAETMFVEARHDARAIADLPHHRAAVQRAVKRGADAAAAIRMAGGAVRGEHFATADGEAQLLLGGLLRRRHPRRTAGGRRQGDAEGEQKEETGRPHAGQSSKHRTRDRPCAAGTYRRAPA